LSNNILFSGVAIDSQNIYNMDEIERLCFLACKNEVGVMMNKMKTNTNVVDTPPSIEDLRKSLLDPTLRESIRRRYGVNVQQVGHPCEKSLADHPGRRKEHIFNSW